MGERDTVQIISSQLSIPSPPAVVQELGALLADSGAESSEVGRILARDPGLARQVLQVASSGCYGGHEQVLDVEQVASSLGAPAVFGIVMRLAVIRHYDYLDYFIDFDLKALWRHAVLTGLTARRLCAASERGVERAAGLTPDDAFTGGLLHDLGQVVLLDSFGESYVELLGQVERSRRPIHIAEAELFGFAHPDVGAVTASSWGLPEAVSEAIELHHASLEERRDSFFASLVTLADHVAYAARSVDPAALRPWSEEAERLGIPPAALDEIVDFAVQLLPAIEA